MDAAEAMVDCWTIAGLGMPEPMLPWSIMDDEIILRVMHGVLRCQEAEAAVNDLFEDRKDV